MDTIIEFIKVLIFSYTRYFIVAGLFYLVLYKLISSSIEHLKIQYIHAKKADFLREISNSMIVAAIGASIAFFFVFTDIVNSTKIYTNVDDYSLWWMPLSFIMALIIHDTYFYWMHRLLHHPKIYKLAHLEHHKSTNPSPWAAYSFDFIEGILEVMIIPVLIFTLPMHFSILVLFSIAVLLINVYGHCGYELMPKSFRKTWLFSIMATSTFHNLHHEKFNYNYSLYFRVWDKIMGTEHPKYEEAIDDVLARKKSGEIFQMNDSLN